MVSKLLMILSRPARLLECLEFDPSIFYTQLEVEEHVLNQNKIDVDMGEYIKNKLGLEDVFSDQNDQENQEEPIKNVKAQRKVKVYLISFQKPNCQKQVWIKFYA